MNLPERNVMDYLLYVTVKTSNNRWSDIQGQAPALIQYFPYV